jgi:hypothetical protein
MFENFHVAYTDGTGESSIEATSVYGGVAVVPTPISRRVGRVSSETAEAPCFQMRGLEMISTPLRNSRGPDNSLIRQDIRSSWMPKSHGKSLILTMFLSER